MRTLVVLLFIILGSCAGGNSPPEQQDNACSIITERPKWYRAMQKTEQNWGVPVHVQLATIWKESNFRSRARTRREWFLFIPTGRVSSAYGFSQAIDGTWDWYKRETGKRRASRSSFEDSVDFIGWYMDMSHQRLGISKSDAYRQYLAYHEGHGGYRSGSYRQKDWLVNVARQVQNQSDRYESQLANCSTQVASVDELVRMAI